MVIRIGAIMSHYKDMILTYIKNSSINKLDTQHLNQKKLWNTSVSFPIEPHGHYKVTNTEKNIYKSKYWRSLNLKDNSALFF